MEVEKSTRSCSTQTSCAEEDSQLYLSALEECEDDGNNSREFSQVGEVIGDTVPPRAAAGQEEEPAESRSPAAAEPSYFSKKPEGAESRFPAAGKPLPAAGVPAVRDGGCRCSRAVNTEVTMMNKTRPAGWPGPASADAASNTEWSFLGRGSGVQQESKDELRVCGWRTGADARLEHPTKQTGENFGSGCCEKALQRAAEAELQLLAIHYEMCQEHCWKVYDLALEENTYFGRCEGKSKLRSSLQLVLDELDQNYSKMRMEISTGTPLKELPPLSVELKLSPVSSFYVPSKFLRRSLYSEMCCSHLSGEEKADSEDPKQQEKGISVSVDKSQTGGEPGASASPDEQPKDQALECGCVKNEEGSEYWFDAKEDLSVADISVMCKETKKQQGKQDSIGSREVKTVGSGNKHSALHVGGPKPSLPEFQNPGEKSLQKTSTCSSLHPSGVFVSPYALNLSSFTKLIKRLQERHPEFSRDEIAEAVQEVRKINKGVLSGLAISSIEEKASAILRRSVQGKR